MGCDHGKHVIGEREARQCWRQGELRVFRGERWVLGGRNSLSLRIIRILLAVRRLESEF